MLDANVYGCSMTASQQLQQHQHQHQQLHCTAPITGHNCTFAYPASQQARDLLLLMVAKAVTDVCPDSARYDGNNDKEKTDSLAATSPLWPIYHRTTRHLHLASESGDALSGGVGGKASSAGIVHWCTSAVEAAEIAINQ